MPRFWARGVLFAIGIVSAGNAPPRQPASVAVPSVSPQEMERASLADAVQKFKDNDEEDARAVLKAVVAAPTFVDLTNAERHTALQMLGSSLIDGGDATLADIAGGRIGSDEENGTSADLPARSRWIQDPGDLDSELPPGLGAQTGSAGRFAQ